MEPTEVVSVMPKRGPSSPKIIVDTNLTVQNSSAIRPTPVKAGKSITHLDNNKQVQVSCLLLFLVLTYTTLHISDSSVMEFSVTDETVVSPLLMQKSPTCTYISQKPSKWDPWY